MKSAPLAFHKWRKWRKTGGEEASCATSGLKAGKSGAQLASLLSWSGAVEWRKWRRQ
jgi:hypothetical protein